MKKIFLPLFVLSTLFLLPVISIAYDLSENKAENVQILVPEKNQNIYTPGLGEIMTVTQMRHSKLWFAGKAANWKLAEYELFELQEGFDDAVKFHPERSKLLLKMTASSMEQLKTSISEKSEIKFQASFKALTSSCNACHKATNFGFNRVIVPLSNPFTNQRFTISQ